ncbi:radial spoke head 1 homolog [Pelobates cultripes]|uniref:Radial spoke head 1 homolog n=1 Tax=Pelobates cultripes TaxID=61616 RepID=A0AAD1R8B5_PELCU|nr:radial spoke head 1 homolog [Pelobates cultripes]
MDKVFTHMLTLGLSMLAPGPVLLGPGKYVFDIGCEQQGSYVQVEKEKEEEEDEEEPLAVPVTKWRAEKICSQSLWSPNEVVQPPAPVVGEPATGEVAEVTEGEAPVTNPEPGPTEPSLEQTQDDAPEVTEPTAEPGTKLPDVTEQSEDIIE